MSDLFAAVGTKTELERAKEVLRAMPDNKDGMKLGAISYLARTGGMAFSAAWDLMDRLVKQGFISETDGHGRRTLL